MTNARRWVLRGAAAVMLFLGLAAPSPGNVGTCGAGINVADPVEFCEERAYSLCRRDQFAGRIDDAQFAQCITPIEATCAPATWPAGCTPSQDQAQACLTLLLRSDLSSLTNVELLQMYDDCAVCGGGSM